MWACFAFALVFFAACAILELHELGVYPLREFSRLIRRPWFEVALILFMVGGIVQYGATKGTNGAELAERPRRTAPALPPVGGAASQDGCSGVGCVSNLCFTEILPMSNSVRLVLAWPTNFFLEGTTLDFFAKVNALTNEWAWIGEENTQAGLTNLEVEIPYPLGTPIPSAMFFTARDRFASALTMSDADQDGMPDVYELHYGTNPYVADSELVPRMTVGAHGDYATVEAALSASVPYSVLNLESETFEMERRIVMPPHPVLLEGPRTGYAVLRSTSEISAVMLTDGQDERTLFRNLIVDLRASRNFQSGFWIGGNTPWTGRGAAVTFENVHVRASCPGVEHFGWLFYREDAGASRLTGCTMNAAGSSWAYGISAFNAASNLVEDCAFLNMPTNVNEVSPIAILIRNSTNGVLSVEQPEDRPDLSWAGYPLAASYDPAADSDGDGLMDYDEVFSYDTDPWIADSDGDGIEDGDEIAGGTDPRDGASHPQEFDVSVVNTEVYADVTNYVFYSSLDEWSSNLVFWCTDGGCRTNICTNALFGVTQMGAFRDLNRNGTFESDVDILRLCDVSGFQAVKTVRFAFGDVDGDGVGDLAEREGGVDPYDRNSYCFEASATVTDIPWMDGRLVCSAAFGTNEVLSAMSVTNAQVEVNFGHLTTSQDEGVTLWFWLDANTNMIRDAGERYVTVPIRQNGHETTYEGTLNTSEFDLDGNGLFDWWEDETGLSAVAERHYGYDDNDHDGLVNLHEYWAGTDPLTPDGSNTLLSVCARSVDDRIRAVVNPSAAVNRFVNFEANGRNGIFIANTNFWAKDLDTGCVSVWNKGGGSGAQSATAITRRHVVMAQHSYGRVYIFCDINGVTYERTVTGDYNIPDTDFRLGRLNEDLPATISTPKILPADYAKFLHDGKYLPVVCVTHEKSASVAELIELNCSQVCATDNVRYHFLGHTAATNHVSVARNRIRAATTDGKSACPVFLVAGNQLVFLFSKFLGYSGLRTWSPYWGPMISHYLRDVQSKIDSWEGDDADRYQLDFLSVESLDPLITTTGEQ